LEALPEYSLFKATCDAGLSAVRPLAPAARQNDGDGWNYGPAWPPSYAAFGRLRVLTALERALSLKPRRVLEVAAGDGALSACLAARGISVAVNDLRTENLESAIANFESKDSMTVLPGNLFDLDPRATGLFDLVIATEVVEHVAHTDKFLRHLARFLTPDGRIFLTTPNGSYFRNGLPTYSMIEDFDALELEQFQPDADGHLFLITPNELRSLAHNAGLRSIEIDLFAIPFITGHCGFSIIRYRQLARLCYWFETHSRRLPFWLREKICFSMSAIFGLGSEVTDAATSISDAPLPPSAPEPRPLNDRALNDPPLDTISNTPGPSNIG
jgi:2-polyprenyl-6-hydroxyphenyl methylase/3-demethylubiquinone-9 3-methyltransferase